MIKENFQHGINLGGWLSQTDCLPTILKNSRDLKNHFDSFINISDIERIAGWGMDHVRLPIDYRYISDHENSADGFINIFDYIDRCLEWCEQFGLNVILDLHDMEGNVYGAMDKPMPLLIDDVLIKRFIDIWISLTIKYKDYSGCVLMFELLNEVSDSTGFLWTELYSNTVKEIRKIDHERPILIGSNEQNSVFRLKELRLLNDKNVCYNFHFYDPQHFTHQKAHFSPEMILYDRSIKYPGTIDGFTEFLLEHREFIPKYSHVCMEEKINEDTLNALLKDAIDFSNYSNCELYCGEFGVITTADDETIANWLNDCMNIFDRNKIGHAIWNYKELDFGIIDINNRIKSEAVIDVISQRTYR